MSNNSNAILSSIHIAIEIDVRKFNAGFKSSFQMYTSVLAVSIIKKNGSECSFIVHVATELL